MAAYSDRSKRWNDILRALLTSKKNLIFVGQIDMELIFTPDSQSSKAVIKVNSMVNEKYYTYIDEKGNYLHEVKKFRTLESVEELEAAAKPITRPVKEVKDEPQEIKDVTPMDNASEIAESIVAELPKKTITAGYEQLIKLNRIGFISDEDCPSIKAELERLLQ